MKGRYGRQRQAEERGDNPSCLLKRWPEDDTNTCRAEECAGCGWNPAVEARRKEELARRYPGKK